MGDSADRTPFGHKPDEHVFDATRPRSPTVRVRVAQRAAQGALRFEPEGEPQAAAVRSALAAGPVPHANLAFEPDEGEILDRVSPRAPARAPAPLAGTPDMAALARLAASVTEDGGAGEGLGGDLESELFGPRSAAPASPGARGPAAQQRAGTAARNSAPGAVPGPPTGAAAGAGGRSWISVFLSDKVAGRRRRQRSTVFLRRTAKVGSAAGRVLAVPLRAVGHVIARVDALTSRLRLPLANIAWSVLILGIALLLGVAPTLSAVFFVACLGLSVCGQPARNLMGFAGIVLSSAAVAEIVRQRERFFEIFMDIFG